MIDLPALMRAASFKGRLVLTRHAVDSPVGWLASDCDAYVAESQTSLDLMQPYTDMKVTIVPNGIDTGLFRRIPCRHGPKPIIAWCGRSQAAFKNLDLYLATTREMSRTDFDFWVADGDDWRPVGGDCGFADSAHVSSWRRYQREEFPLFYSQIAASGGCLLGTSLYEGLPLTILEALACACPVVAMNSRGVNDIMTGDLARWLYSRDASPSEVQRFLLESLSTMHAKPTLTGLRRHVVEHFSVDVMVEGNLTAYQACEPAQPLPTNRATISENLWRHAASTLLTGGRARDALFAMKAAMRLLPLSTFRRGHLGLLLRTLNDARLRAARQSIECARAAFAGRDRKAGLRDAWNAIRIHPGILLDRRTIYGANH
jgi:hypothetical protein